MTRIIYGFSGEGSGHSSRARELARSLLDADHEVKLCSYDRGYNNLKDEFDVLEIEGLTIGSSDNRVSMVKTFTENFRRIPEAGRKAVAARDLFRSFKPHCVITDFEPLTAYLAHHYAIPLISVDNQHRMRYVDYDGITQLESDAARTKTIIRLMIPSPDVCLVTSLIPGTPRNDRTYLFPPMVAREVQQLHPTEGSHILVYVTSGFETLIDLLPGFPREQFHVYGTQRDASKERNIHYFPSGRSSFLKDLASAKAVIATAGFTLISESLYLRKPYLAFPMKGQYEQELNAVQLQSAKWGRARTKPSHDAIASFLYGLPELKASLQQASIAPDNSAITSRLLELVANDAHEAQAFRQLRKGQASTGDSVLGKS